MFAACVGSLIVHWMRLARFEQCQCKFAGVAFLDSASHEPPAQGMLVELRVWAPRRQIRGL